MTAWSGTATSAGLAWFQRDAGQALVLVQADEADRAAGDELSLPVPHPAFPHLGVAAARHRASLGPQGAAGHRADERGVVLQPDHPLPASHAYQVRADGGDAL